MISPVFRPWQFCPWNIRSLVQIACGVAEKGRGLLEGHEWAIRVVRRHRRRLPQQGMRSLLERVCVGLCVRGDHRRCQLEAISGTVPGWLAPGNQREQVRPSLIRTNQADSQCVNERKTDKGTMMWL